MYDLYLFYTRFSSYFVDSEEECDDLNIYMEGGRCVLKLEAPK